MDVQLDADLRAIIEMSDKFGRHRVLVWAYVELFGITPLRAKAKRVRKLLEEMNTLIENCTYRYQKRRYEISTDGIAEALNIVIHRNFADGLDSHNYLKKVMITISEREARDAGRSAENKLRRREERLQAGQRENTVEPEEQPAGGSLTPEQIEKNKARVNGLLKTLR